MSQGKLSSLTLKAYETRCWVDMYLCSSGRVLVHGAGFAQANGLYVFATANSTTVAYVHSTNPSLVLHANTATRVWAISVRRKGRVGNWQQKKNG